MSSSTAVASIIYLGLDVHKETVTIAVLPADAKAPTRIDTYPHDFTKLRRVFERHAKDGELRACYEASGAGYVLLGLSLRRDCTVADSDQARRAAEA